MYYSLLFIPYSAKKGGFMKLRKIILSFALILFAFNVSAHPPKKITLKFDAKTQELDINIDHAVKDMNDHFVEKITVNINGTLVSTTEYKKQKDLKGDVYRIKLADIKVGDLIEVTANCNKWGKKSKKLTVE